MIDNISHQALEACFGTLHFNKLRSVQSLWSGYGEIARYDVSGRAAPIILKIINIHAKAAHPRGWESATAHTRKLSSYLNEQVFYKQFSEQLNERCRTPKYISSGANRNAMWLVLEDADHKGYEVRRNTASFEQASLGVTWLANFHAQFLNSEGEGLWPIGTYWHLQTRKQEWQAMPDSNLKQQAQNVSNALQNCRYSTLVHGDAKIANFCFNSDCSDVLALDFQYVGKGCGIQDLVYFLGSCLSADDLERYASDLKEYYFEQLKQALAFSKQDHLFPSVKTEWSELYKFAWADFERFLRGWSPSHHKLNQYSEKQTNLALATLKKP
ncbi:phosphotransferase [Ningiella sp. W23]|uniref:phosphotransferase n=1 Tax=Ningiella sp. W23 TaxID=3023715 RepID=UPI003756E019